MNSTSPRIAATLIPGDGIGPEITEATLEALDALGAPFQWDRQVAGMAGVTACGDPLPPACLDSIRNTKLALKGPLETPDRRRLSLVQRPSARRVQTLRQPAPGKHHRSRRPLRQHRPGAGAREQRRALHGLRALHPDRRRSACGRNVDRHQYPPGLPPHRAISPSTTPSARGARRSRWCTRPTS